MNTEESKEEGDVDAGQAPGLVDHVGHFEPVEQVDSAPTPAPFMNPSDHPRVKKGPSKKPIENRYTNPLQAIHSVTNRGSVLAVLGVLLLITILANSQKTIWNVCPALRLCTRKLVFHSLIVIFGFEAIWRHKPKSVAAKAGLSTAAGLFVWVVFPWAVGLKCMLVDAVVLLLIWSVIVFVVFWFALVSHAKKMQ